MRSIHQITPRGEKKSPTIVFEIHSFHGAMYSQSYQKIPNKLNYIRNNTMIYPIHLLFGNRHGSR